MKRGNLDELQEQKLLKIEEKCFSLAMVGLIIIMLAELILPLAVESLDHNTMYICALMTCALIVILCGVELMLCFKNGIWSRKLKPNNKTNIATSIISGCAAALVVAVVRFIDDGFAQPHHIVIGAALTGAFTFALCFGMLSIVKHSFNKKQAKIDKDLDREEEEESNE